MADELVAHVCKICGSAWPTRAKAKKHVNHRHLEDVSHRYGPGQHVSYLWMELERWRQ